MIQADGPLSVAVTVRAMILPFSVDPTVGWLCNDIDHRGELASSLRLKTLSVSCRASLSAAAAGVHADETRALFSHATLRHIPPPTRRRPLFQVSCSYNSPSSLVPHWPLSICTAHVRSVSQRKTCRRSHPIAALETFWKVLQPSLACALTHIW